MDALVIFYSLCSPASHELYRWRLSAPSFQHRDELLRDDLLVSLVIERCDDGCHSFDSN